MTSSDHREALSLRDRTIKRTFDLLFALVGLVLLWWVIAVGVVIASVDTRRLGLFVQPRVGRYGRLFPLFKLRTMRDTPGHSTSVTTSEDPRITTVGRLLRRTKLDELPQLVNVLVGHMSVVGPRPDVKGFADRLTGSDRVILLLRPGLTGPATLRFRDEEALLAEADDPEHYNAEVLFPEKIRLNRQYIEEYRFREDLRIVAETAAYFLSRFTLTLGRSG